MPKITINGTVSEAAEGTSVLAVCRGLGITIPTMCYLDGHTHFTSCMVCVVKDTTSDRLIPACSAPVTDGMVIETDSDDVIDARRVAVELLLSEHVGDCEGPCQRVCPAQINVPAVIRKLAGRDRAGAAAVYRNSQTQPGIPCIECAGRCEKPCRRGQIDDAVSIRLLMICAANACDTGGGGIPRPKRFNSVIGRLHDDEKATVLATASDRGRVEPTAEDSEFTVEEAAREAARCLHCDCRKPETCRLREYAEQYGCRQSRYKATERKPIQIMRQHPSVVYDPGKCILCGICVKITEQSQEPIGMAFLRRGYDAHVGVPFNDPLSDALTTTAEECIRRCPTGALAHDSRNNARSRE